MGGGRYAATSAIADPRGRERTVELPAGTIAYRERGSGPVVVFVHGVGVNGELWRQVVPPLAHDYRCITPDLPWGSHCHPLRADADLSLPGMAGIVADFLTALDLHDVTVVGNDTGGAVSQALASHRPERLGRLVLTSCDAFDHFPPTPQKYLVVAARSRLMMWLVAAAARLRLFQRTPLAYGWVTSAAMPREVMRAYTRPLLADPLVRRDMRRMLRAVNTAYTY